MSGKMTAVFIAYIAVIFITNYGHVDCNPAIATGYDAMEICIENCAQCKKMLGDWFEGPLCAESCIKFKGKLIPDCEDIASIAPFINKL